LSGKERGRGFAELLQVDMAAVTARRMAWFLVAAVMSRQCRPGGGDGWADDAIPRYGGDGGEGGQGGSGLLPGMTLKAEEERDGDSYGGGGAGQRDS
jgi:hypothetical protein